MGKRAHERTMPRAARARWQAHVTGPKKNLRQDEPRRKTFLQITDPLPAKPAGTTPPCREAQRLERWFLARKLYGGQQPFGPGGVLNGIGLQLRLR